AICIIIAALTIVGKSILFPRYDEIETTGLYEIACEDYWVTEDQLDPFLKDGSLREVQVRAWYPKGYDNLDAKLPVVIASHGSCGSIDNNLSLYREFASHSYVVLAIGHPGHAFDTLHSDGKYLDKYATADTSRFVTLGHSAALGMARTRTDVVGVIALGLPCMYDIKGIQDGEYIMDDSDYEIPVLNVYSDASYSHLSEWKQYRNNANFLESENENYENIYYAGTGHMGLCDLSLASPFWQARWIR
ncbi:MAG: hypothetical protein MR528_00205, partial [Lachnospiraceae bacterium]|nr:hypothetical protein [Lachnospiraceae bacterium]